MTFGNDSCGGDHRRDCNNGPKSWIYGNSWSAATAQKAVNKYAEVSRGPFVPSLTGAGCCWVQISMGEELVEA